jgi:hypothetical protein
MWSLTNTDSTICWMKTFTDHELKLIRKLNDRPADTVLEIKEPCPLHSYCSPLPLFRVYKIDDSSFEAQWNEYHRAGVKQGFRFDEVASD